MQKRLEEIQVQGNILVSNLNGMMLIQSLAIERVQVILRMYSIWEKSPPLDRPDISQAVNQFGHLHLMYE